MDNHLAPTWLPILFHLTSTQPILHWISTWKPLDIQSTSIQHSIDIHLISTGHPHEIQLKSTWHPFNDSCTTNWPTLHNPWFDIGFVVKWNSLIGILFSTGFFWSCYMEQNWVGFDTPLFHITRAKQPRVNIYVHSPLAVKWNWVGSLVVSHCLSDEIRFVVKWNYIDKYLI